MVLQVRHSRNNTASASFTKAEYNMLGDRWGSKKIKLGAESFKQFDQCSLCLNKVESPVMCNRGHLYCKECIFSSLLEQKKEFAQVKATLDRLGKEHQAQQDRAREDAMERVQKDFDRVQSGVGRGARQDREDDTPRIGELWSNQMICSFTYPALTLFMQAGTVLGRLRDHPVVHWPTFLQG